MIACVFRADGCFLVHAVMQSEESAVTQCVVPVSSSCAEYHTRDLQWLAGSAIVVWIQRAQPASP